MEETWLIPRRKQHIVRPGDLLSNTNLQSWPTKRPGKGVESTGDICPLKSFNIDVLFLHGGVYNKNKRS